MNSQDIDAICEFANAGSYTQAVGMLRGLAGMSLDAAERYIRVGPTTVDPYLRENLISDFWFCPKTRLEEARLQRAELDNEIVALEKYLETENQQALPIEAPVMHNIFDDPTHPYID